jgi:hypothetical protein
MTDLKVVPTAQPTVFDALNQVKTAIGAVKKGERNTSQNFNFRGIDAVVNAAAPELNRQGVIVTPEILEHTYETVEIGKNKTPMGHVTVAVKYTFWGPSGDSLASTVLAEAMDSGDKACAKAMSVAYRIALLQTLNLPTDEPDPDSESFERTSNVTSPAPVVRTVPPVQGFTSGVTVNWVEKIAGASTLDGLRQIWKDAGAAGALQSIVISDVGEKVSVQDLLYQRSDILNAQKSD